MTVLESEVREVDIKSKFTEDIEMEGKLFFFQMKYVMCLNESFDAYRKLIRTKTNSFKYYVSTMINVSLYFASFFTLRSYIFTPIIPTVDKKSRTPGTKTAVISPAVMH